MKLTKHLAYLFPLALFACATLPKIATDHPAHPEATQAQLAPLSGTLAIQNVDLVKRSPESRPAGSMSHDHGDRSAMSENEKQVTLYTCPMDPEVVRDKPGKCPICGMRLKLKPTESKADEKGNGHDQDH